MKKKLLLFFFSMLLGIGLIGAISSVPTTVHAEEVPVQITAIESNSNQEQATVQQVKKTNQKQRTSSGMIETKKKKDKKKESDEAYSPLKGYNGKDGQSFAKFKLVKPPSLLSPTTWTSGFGGAGIFGWLMEWNIYWDVAIMQFLYGMVSEAGKINSDGTFSEASFREIQNFFNYFAYFCLAVGVIFSITDTAVQYQNGNGNFINCATNFIKAVIYTFTYSKLVPIGYYWATYVADHMAGNKLSESIGSLLYAFTGGSNGNYTETAARLLRQAVSSGTLIIELLLVLVFMIFYIKHIFAIAKRLLMLLALLVKGSVMPFGLARGSTSEFSSFAGETVMFFLGIILQEWSFFTGVLLLTRWNIVVGFAFMECSNEVFQYLGAINASGENVLGGIHNIVCTANSARGLIGGITSGGGTSAAAASTSAAASAAETAATVATTVV